MITVIIASAFFGLGVALFYYLKVSRIPLTQGIDNPEEASKFTVLSLQVPWLF